MQTDLILIGGFLGAGKTTFLREISKFLAADGKKVGLITNDQATALVDTAFLGEENDQVVEVSGSCFCCNYNGFLDAVNKLRRSGMETILAEPVGSCTDLSATIMQPLKDKSGKDCKIYPLSVLVDPFRLEDLLEDRRAGLHPSAVYIALKQLEEADLIVINKADLLSARDMDKLIAKTKAAFPDKPVLALSAKTGSGFAAWLKAATEAGSAGKTIAEVDYDIYAEGEAVLGWLNLDVKLKRAGADWNALAGSLLYALAEEFDAAALSVAHVKIRLEAGGRSILGNITGKKHTVQLRNSAGRGAEALLTVNARVETAPPTLLNLVQRILQEQCAAAGVKYDIAAAKCLSPGRPDPTYRYDNVVVQADGAR